MLQRLINDQAAAEDISANQLAGTQRFVFDSQHRRPPWLRGCTLRRLHGCPAAQDAPRDPPVGPTLVPVPQWWRYEVPLRLPNVTHWPIFERPLEAPRPASRSSYKKAKRPTAPTAPRACDRVTPSTRLVYSFIRRRVSQGSQAIRPYSSVLLGRSRNNENKREQKTKSQSQHPNIKHLNIKHCVT